MKTGKGSSMRFGIARRGYDCAEVDSYVARTETEIAALNARLVQEESALQSMHCAESALRAKLKRLETAATELSAESDRRRDWIRLGTAVLVLIGTLCAGAKERKGNGDQ